MKDVRDHHIREIITEKEVLHDTELAIEIVMIGEEIIVDLAVGTKGGSIDRKRLIFALL